MKKTTILKSMLCLVMAMVCNVAWAQAVIFPQEQQPGTAVVKEVNDGYTIGNELFTAKFVKADGKLTFGGCEELGLIAGSEIFKVALGDGTEIPASAFTLGNVVVETLAGNSAAVKAVRRYNGKQIKATFTHESGLTIEWRAVLRDGSHYLRTEMDILNSGSEGIAMNSIYPMLYTVQNNDGEKAPVVVGNTRGAVIASDKIFAGVETPTAYNMAGEATDLESFVFKAWDGAGSWAWTPEENDIPAGIKGLSQYVVGAVNASRGYLIFREAGDCTITLDYTEGSNRLQILGVDILDVKGNVIDTDYHFGFTGGSDNKRDYTVTIPEVGAYMVRIFVTNAGNGEGYGSKGTIAYSTKVTLPELVYDLASTETPRVDPEVTVPETEEEETQPEKTFALFADMTYYMAANAKQSNGSYVPYYLYIDENGALKTSDTCVEDNVNYKWTLVANGTDAWYIKNGGGKYLSYTSGGIKAGDSQYSFELKNDAVMKDLGIYSLYNKNSSGGKYMVTKVDGTSFNQNGTARNDGQWCSDYLFTPIAPESVGSWDGKTPLTDNWTDGWTGFSNWEGALPAGVTKRGTAKSKTTGFYNIGTGILNILFDYTRGSHGLYVLGVQVLGIDGSVVAQQFKDGFTGSNSTVDYEVIVPEAGVYSIRYIVDYIPNQGTNTNGDITLSFEAVASITTEVGAEGTWASSWEGFAVLDNAPEDLKAFNSNKNGTVDPTSVQHKDCTYLIEPGKLLVEFEYSGGSHGLYPMGVALLDAEGKVVAKDYHPGFTGGIHKDNTYSVKVLEKGLYTVRYIVDKNSDGTVTNGNITLSLEKNVVDVLGTINEDETLADAWTPSDWKTMPADEVPNRVNETGCTDENARVIEQQITITSAGTLSVEFLYATGSARLNMVGVDLLDATGNVAVDDYHVGYTGTEKSANVYKFNVFAPGTYTIRYFADNAEAINSTGNINLKLTVDYTLHLVAPKTTPLTGKWSRVTSLKAGEEWNIGAVVGVIAPGQARRSFLCYSERERAVPWRAVPAYISWYELNINRNNAAPGHEHENFTEEQCLPILREWKAQLFDKYGEAPYAFVWDDGWDTYGEWQFHSGFPNGFTNMDIVGREMGAGQGAWLGPVGGYGTSGGYRRNYWGNKGGMQLSNPLYYEVFVNAVTGLLKDKGYDFRFFKFDGISAQFSAVGPDAGATGNENAEAIIMAEKVLRGIKEDVFLNTTVGTWASPFWFQHTDAVWRQEKDDGTIGNNSNNRENWITYRDRLVYQNFVQNSPLCPINTLMTHGFILTEFGGPAGFSRDWKSVINELRCAFACGSGMVELYNDYKLTNSLVNPATGNAGELWGEIAKCMQWQRENADVLPDIHWVGGNPWTGAKAEVYGWAAWNAQKAVLTLRNGANNAQDYTFTLREALDIPAYVNTSITLTKAFADQLALDGLTEGKAIDIDTELTVTLPGSSVYVFDGADNNPTVSIPAIIGEQKMGTFYANEAVVIPEGVKAYVATESPVMDEVDAEGNITGGVITMSEIEGGIVPAKTGVLICGEQGTYNFISTTDEVSPIEGNLMKGYAGAEQYENVQVSDDATIYILTVKNGIPGFYKKSAAFKVYNHKAYLEIPASTKVGALRISFAEEEATEIEHSEFTNQNSDLIYDLMGRRVEKMVKGGVYVVNGKKVVK